MIRPRAGPAGNAAATTARRRRRSGRPGVVLATTAALCLVGAGPATAPVVPPHVPAGDLSVVALGDSVPSGAGCGCEPFPRLYGTDLARQTGRTVVVSDEGANGETTSGLLTALASDPVRSAVTGANVVLVTIGANDFTDHEDDVTSGACSSSNPDCVSDEMAGMRTRLAAILTTIATLRHDMKTTVLVTGYWNVFEDGDVAVKDYGRTGRDASVVLTERVNAAIESDAEQAGCTYVDLFAPFQVSGRRLTSLLAIDGDHPSASGHRLIADVLLDAGLPRART